MTGQDKKKIDIMIEGGKVLGKILQELMDFSEPGVLLNDIEALAQKRIKEAGMKPSFSTVANYKWATCLCVNEVIVHGIPNAYELREDDVLTVDIGLINSTYHLDTAWSKVMHKGSGKTDPDVQKFLDTGKLALEQAIREVKPGNRVGHISQTIQKIVEGSGYGIVKPLVGHGIGTTLHEPPQIPGYLRGNVEKTPLLVPGMTIAVEVIYSMGKPAVTYLEDGWSIATQDGSLSAVFEQSLAITDEGCIVLTPKPNVI